MGYINQRHSKDCVTATLANLLGMKYEDVPQFWELDPSLKTETPTKEELRHGAEVADSAVEEWLAENGYIKLTYDVYEKDGKPFLPKLSKYPALALGYVSTPSHYDHAVLVEVSESRIDLIHDPLDLDYSNGFPLKQIDFVMRGNFINELNTAQ